MMKKPLPSKTPPALKKREREKLENELESGPAVDQRRDEMMRKVLAGPKAKSSAKKK